MSWILAVLAGLAVVTAAPHAAAATKYWVGPGCPSSGWTCQGTDTTNFVQNQASGPGSVNHANCTDTCNVTQTATGGAANEAVCTQSTTDSGTQSCTFDQTNDTGSNTITSQQDASLTPPNQHLTTLTQDSDQKLTTKQTNTSGPNSLTATQTIKQSAKTSVDMAVDQTQETLQLANVNQNNTSGANSATITLARNQKADATGNHVTQHQDVRENGSSDPPSSADPNGRILLDQENSTGANTAKLRGSDEKSQKATSLDGFVLQHQGHSAGGWLAQVKMNHVGGSGPSNLDVGSPGSNDGLTKNWTQHAAQQNGQPASEHHQQQIDLIQIPAILHSEDDSAKTNEKSTISGDPGTQQACNLSASGHVDGNWTGQISCSLSDQKNKTTQTVPFSGADIDASLQCSQNEPSEGPPSPGQCFTGPT